MAVLPDVPFDALDHEQREQFMRDRVMPTMSPLFREHDPKKFAEFSCKTCHGDRAETDHEMPNPALIKLDFADLSKLDQKTLEFMTKTVKPTMAKLLREPERSDVLPKGFGCTHCHEQL